MILVMPRERILKVNNLVREVLGDIVTKEYRTSQDELITIVGVDATPNLQQAKVYISVLPEERAKEAIKKLKRDVFRIQQSLNSRLQMRPVPRIEFVEDKQFAKAQKLGELLDKIEKEGK